MQRNLLLAIVALCLLPVNNIFSQSGDCPYPVIFLHGWTGSESSFAPVYNNSDFQNIWGDLTDIFHAVVNAQEGTHIWGNDGIPYNNDDDVLVTFTNETNDLAPGCLYAINLDNYWNENTNNPQIYIHDGGSPSFTTSDSNESAIFKQGYALGEMIKKVLAANPGKEKVILIAHSMGGLESREYLQRRDNSGTPMWWVDPTSPDGHKVAKLVTTTTPHRGSNTMGNVSSDNGHEEDIFRDGLPDLTSEAVRDLRYSYGCGFLDLDDCPGNYLFGGDEDDIGTWFYTNADVDCDGNENNTNIIGINIKGTAQGFSEDWHGTYDNPLIPLPTNVRYTWITSDIAFDSGDGVVAWSRQWLYNGSTPMPSDGTPFRLADTLLSDQSHLSINSDLNTVLRGFDEGDFPNFAWQVQTGIQYAGIPQVRSILAPDGPYTSDPDWFSFTLPYMEMNVLEVELIPNQNLGGRIDFFTSNPGLYTGQNTTASHSSTFGPGTNTVNLFIPKDDLSPGSEYFVRIIHNGIGPNDWKTPYQFTITPALVLPLKLLSFEGKANDHTVDLLWETEQELNIDYFEIEKADDGINFIKTGTVDAKNNYESLNNYLFTDKNPKPGNNYYRLKIIDKNGSFEYSKQINVWFEQKQRNLTLFPNPVGEELSVHFDNTHTSIVNFSIFNSIGQKVIYRQLLPSVGRNQIQLDVSGLSSGLYFLEIEQSGLAEKVKFAVE